MARAGPDTMAMPLRLDTQSVKTLSNKEFIAQQMAVFLQHILHRPLISYTYE